MARTAARPAWNRDAPSRPLTQPAWPAPSTGSLLYAGLCQLVGAINDIFTGDTYNTYAARPVAGCLYGGALGVPYALVYASPYGALAACATGAISTFLPLPGSEDL